MYYSNQTGEIPVYETDDEGDIRYIYIDGVQTPVPTGETEIGHSEPKEFYSSLSMSGGDTEDKAYGIDTSAYDATLICPKNAFEIKEGTLIWHKSEIVFTDEDKTSVEPTSADYTVIKVSESLNFTKYVLKALTK
jgi:hypothetical protein